MDDINVRPSTGATDFAELLAAFLRRVEQLFHDRLEDAPFHVRWATAQGGSLVGSSVGAVAWDSDEGKALMAWLLADPELGVFQGEPIIQSELRAIIAGVVKQWIASGSDPSTFSHQSDQAILTSLREPVRTCVGLALAYGVSVNRTVELPGGVYLIPDVKPILDDLSANGVICERDLVRMQSGWGCGFYVVSRISREHFGPLAGITASSWVHIESNRLINQIWLSTGIRCLTGDVFVGEHSAYPQTGPDRFPVGIQGIPRDNTLLSEGDIERIIGLRERLLPFYRGEPVCRDRETDVQIRLALSQVDLITRLRGDSVTTALMSYIAIDGLLLDRETEVSRFGPRAASLISRDKDERKMVRQRAEALGRFRGTVGHGGEPSLPDLSALLNRPVTADEFDGHFSWDGHDAGRLLDRRTTELLRRVVVCFLWIAVVGDGKGGAQPGLSRKQIIQGIEAKPGDSFGDSLSSWLALQARHLFPSVEPW